MPLSVLILRLDPMYLRVLCALGFVSGLAAFWLAFRKQQTLPELHQCPDRTVQDEMLEPTAGPASSQPESVPQVIRLSLPPIATRSTEMTQQEKVAAALMRAGVVNPASWTNSSTTQVAPESISTTVAEHAAQAIPQHVLTPTRPIPQPRLNWKRKLLLIAGALLALASAYVLLRIH